MAKPKLVKQLEKQVEAVGAEENQLGAALTQASIWLIDVAKRWDKAPDRQKEKYSIALSALRLLAEDLPEIKEESKKELKNSES